MVIGEREKSAVRQKFAALADRVGLIMFTQETECQYCYDTRTMVEQLAELSDHVTTVVYNFVTDKPQVEAYSVTKIPAVAVVGARDYGVRYYGIPSGYEFGALIDDIVDVAAGDSGLAPASRAQLATLSADVHLQVFTTPTCPYCPQAVRLAHRFAIESDRVRADCVEATEFPHLVTRYQVRGVPRTVVNEASFVDGAVPEATLLAAVLRAADQYDAPPG